MKRRTKTQKIGDCFDAFKCIKEGRKVKRSGAKDGSIPTHPVIPCPDLSEHDVQVECMKQLNEWGIFHNRHDCGAGDFGWGFATYGIKSAGDDIGILPDGRHFELEYKKGRGGRQSKGQQKRMHDVRKTNGLYFVIHGVPELIWYMGGLI